MTQPSKPAAPPLVRYSIYTDQFLPATQKDIDLLSFLLMDIGHWSLETPAMPLQTYRKQLSARLKAKDLLP